jgi:signal transduction histidine kinase
MKQTPATREALRIFRLLLVVKLALFGLSSLALWGLGVRGRMVSLVYAAPTVLLALLVFTPWLERLLGHWFLALAVGLDMLFDSLRMAALLFSEPLFWSQRLGLPPEAALRLAEMPGVEPFFFLLIPLVLLAWGYGRDGALWGSTWAALLHLITSLAGWQPDVASRTFLLLLGTRVIALYAVPFIVGVLADRERQKLAQLEAAHQRLRRHAVTVEQLAVSRERNRLARDLHDTLAHSLSALVVQLEALKSLMDHDPEAAQEVLAEVSEQARKGLDESREAIQALRSGPVETLGLTDALRDMLQSFQARTGVLTDLAVAGQARDLTPVEAQSLYRIAEEALNNVERHAGAGRVNLRLEYGADCTDLIVRDDGVGFDATAVDLDRYGLTGMRERAAIIGAELEVRSHPGGGTEVWCSLGRD